MRNTNSLEKAIKAIRENKKYGDTKAVAKKLNVTPQYVSMVCSPHSEEMSEDVIVAMLEHIARRQERDGDKISRNLNKIKATA